MTSLVNSEYSENLEKAASELPDTPTVLTKNKERSSRTSIFLEWDKVANKDVATMGYLLWISSDAAGTQNFDLVLNGTNRPELTGFEATGLETGASYRFKIQALNFNGAS